ncbi:MAG: M67 family metallopeptidase [Phycisphaerae bacterium]|nr:M67 family metallopeptidase [Phycisphaerae bacterium]
MIHHNLALTLPVEVHTQILAHARAKYPHECCGLLVGTSARLNDKLLEVKQSIAATNHAAAADQRSAYAIDSRFWLQQDRLAAATGLKVLGIYHSHPDHPAVPSATDLRLAWPVYVYLIVSVGPAGTTALRGWILNPAENQFVEVAVRTLHQ